MNQELSPNTPLSHYRIVSKIGEGGMGEVYLAQDTKLDRKVAIKFLHEEFSKDTDKLNRFVQEAKAASALNHPNILIVHEIGEVDGKNYIATELIDGKTLREHLSYKEPQSLNTILKIGVQVSEALSAAHQAGIIHRDIKPENIMLRKDGYAKVLDFGLAKLTEKRHGDGETGRQGDGATGRDEDESNTLIAASPRPPVPLSPISPSPGVNTTPGLIMGTVSYMSPEQARGKVTDARTDLWSLGVVLYEMLAGRVPFAGETINHTIVSILEKEPLRLDNVPSELQRIVRKAMTKDVEMRYQSARDLLIDLKNLRRELDLQGELERSIVPNRAGTTESVNENQTQVYASGSAVATSSGQAAATQSVTTSSSSLEYAVTQARNNKLATAIVVLVLLGAISTAGYFAFVSKGGAEQIKSIAVLPFANATGDKEADFLAEGIAETLINNFTKIPELRVTARSTAFRFRGREGEPKAVGSELGVGSILTGRLMQRGDNLSIQVDLINTSDGAQLWGNRYDGKISDIVTIQQRIATDVSQQLKLKLTGAQEQQIARTYTQNPEAYQHYLRGRFHWNRRTSDGMALAVAEFQKAVEKDPTYAFGYVGLADAFVLEQEYGSGTSVQTLSNARAYALRALEIDPSLGEAHATLALAAHYSYQWAEAEAHFKKAIELTPRYATTYQWFAGALRDAGRNAEALEMILKAKELDPLSGIIGVNAGLTHARTGDIKSAVEQLTKVIELDRSWWGGYFWLGFVELIAGKKEDALRYLEKGVELNRSSRTLGTYGFVLGVTGRKAEAIAVARELEQSYDAGGNFAVNIAAVYSGLGEKDKAFEWLEKAFADRNAEMTRLRWYPQFNPLRDDSRFKAMLKRMNLPE